MRARRRSMRLSLSSGARVRYKQMFATVRDLDPVGEPKPPPWGLL